MNWPKRCTVCGITQKEIMQICFLPICPTFQLRMSQLEKKGTPNENLPRTPHRPRPEPRLRRYGLSDV